MAGKVYVRRYAQAVFELALEANELDQWQSDLGKIVSTVGDTEILAWLESPRVRLDAKVKLLSRQLKGINHLALNLILWALTKGRLSVIGDLADEYQRLVDNYRGIESAEVITAIPLDDEDKQMLAKHLGAIFAKKVSLKSEVDPAVIGGFTARVGDKLLDGSTRGKLEALKKELIGVGR